MRKEQWSALRQNSFILITLLGCLAPWITPRHFPEDGPSDSERTTAMGELRPVERQAAGRIAPLPVSDSDQEQEVAEVEELPEIPQLSPDDEEACVRLLHRLKEQ